jgi:pimeloyl-ACP methyl ester carboxylesterase
MANIYCISGLGADHAVFQRIRCKGYTLVPVAWIAPLHRESLSAYASRLMEKIKDECPIIMGVSFGGMLATEMAKTNDKAFVILISSTPRFDNYGRVQKWILNSKLYSWVPNALFKIYTPIIGNWFGVKTKEDKQLLKQIIRRTDISFVKWALQAIGQWNNTYIPNNIRCIQGTQDKIIPFDSTIKVIPIASAGHLMIWTHAQQVSKILSNLLLNK